MGLLGNCWLIIESFVIPDGKLKWFYLSFHIHPVFVSVCLLFVWLKLLNTWLLLLVSYPLRLIYFPGLSVFRLFKSFITFIFSSTKVPNVDFREGTGNLEIAVQVIYMLSQLVESHSFLRVTPIRCQLKLLDYEKDEFERKEDYRAAQSSIFLTTGIVDSDCESYSSLHSSNESSTSICCSNLLLQDSIEESPAQDSSSGRSRSIYSSNILSAVERQVIVSNREEDHGDEESDGFYKEYCERMGWFDILNYDRTCGISRYLYIYFSSPTNS